MKNNPVGFAVACALALSGCGQDGDDAAASGKEIPQLSPAALEAIMANAREHATWTYTDQPDRLHDEPIHLACLGSRDLATVSGPDGQQTAETGICFRHRVGDLLVGFFGTTAGAFDCAPPEGCEVMVRMDNDPAFPVSAVQARNDPSTLYIADPSEVLPKITAAKRMLIELPFSGTGRQVTELNVMGLDLMRLATHAAPSPAPPATPAPAAMSDSESGQASGR